MIDQYGEDPGLKALADEILRQETGLANGSLIAVGGYLLPRGSDEAVPVHACCGSWGPEHRYRCPERTWPATATPEIRRKAIRGDCIGPAHAQIEDLARGLDYQQRKRLTEILAQVWDDGFGYGQQAEGREP